MYKKECKKYFSNLDSSKICDNKTFWKTIQPFFSEKRKITNKIALIDEDETVISNDQLISKELNQFSQNVTKAVNIRENSYLSVFSSNAGKYGPEMTPYLDTCHAVWIVRPSE